MTTSLIELLIEDCKNTEEVLQFVLSDPQIGRKMKELVENRLIEMHNSVELAREGLQYLSGVYSMERMQDFDD